MRTDKLPILQQVPFRFVHCMENWTIEGATTEFTINPQTYFVEDSILQVAGIMENMAQSCAAVIGKMVIERGEHVHIMPLCAVNKMRVYRLPRVGDVLRTKVDIVDLDFGIYLMEVSVYVNMEQIATAMVKVGE